MIRDQKPLTSLGSGLTSRDIEIQENSETEEGPSPNSGYISKKLHGHPVARFIAANIATIGGTAIAGLLVRKGGLRLAKSVDQAARQARQMGRTTFSTKIVETVRRTQKNT